MNEIWKDIEGYENLYQVSNLGRIKSFYKWDGKKYIQCEHFIKGSKQKCAYNYKRIKVSLTKNEIKKDYFLHRLVAEAFIPKVEGKEIINHKDGNPLNNRVDNLEWCTQKENIEHSYKYLRKKKYDENKVVEMFKKDYSKKAICDENNITSIIYYRILKSNGLKPKGTGYYRDKYKISLEELLKDFKKGFSNKELVKKYNCSPDIIARRKYQFKIRGLL